MPIRISPKTTGFKKVESKRKDKKKIQAKKKKQ